MILPAFVCRWINGKAFTRPRGRQTASRRRARLHLEALEDRTVPSTVMNLSDSGLGSLRQAILDTPSGGTVDFQSGLTGTITLGSELAISQNLTITGPGADVITVSGHHASRVFDITGAFTVDISGLTVADGVAAGPDYRGGGIYNNGGTLTVTDSIFSGNTARTPLTGGSGGAIYNAGTLTVTDSTFSGNTTIFFSGGSGGGIYNAGTLTVTDSTLNGNVSLSGGGIYNAGTLTVTDSTLNGNVSLSGGGIYNAGTLTVTDSSLNGNGHINGVGGGIHNALGGMATVTASTLSRNFADIGGGIRNLGTLTVTGSTISFNSTHDGGGIMNRGTLTVTDSTLSGNSAIAGPGGGIYNQIGTATVTNSTLSGNRALLGGGGIFGGGLTVTNTIVAGNTSSRPGPDVRGGLNGGGHNLIGIGAGGSGYADTDLVGTAASPLNPLLGPLQHNGGPTQTMALLPGSPALNAGDPAQLGVADQRGVVRTGGVNIGAYQASTSAFVLAAPDTATAGVPFDLAVTAVDAFGQTAVGYTGTVTFQTTDTRSGVVLPANYSFNSADAGRHTFAGATTLVTAGSQTVTATDTADGSITGFAAVTVDPAAATQLVLSYSSNPVKGQAWSVTVTAYDAFGNVATGYTGTVRFASSDDEAGLPADYTFTAADAGTRTFQLTFERLGHQSLTVADTLDVSIFGMIDVVVQNRGQGGH
jgi:hypothetical protein